jgi:hypothetical protein
MVGEEVALDKSRSNDTLLSVQATKDHISELGIGICHRKRSRAGAILCLDDFVTTKLDAVHKLAIGFTRDGLAVCILREQQYDLCARMATDDRNYGFLGVIAADFTKEARSTDNIEGGDIEQMTRSKTPAF